ncbi:MAG: biopolymer transporter ExbD [Acidobacteriia bacterium]|nr:biopolymer transporter ExbD [Terriglobia bacterium]
MAMTAGTGHGPKSDINMTPMIDILLVLIIIFLVITPIISKGLDTLVPQPPKDQKQQTAPDNRTVAVTIEADGSLKINQEPTSWEALGPRLDDIFKTRSERVMFVRADDSIQMDRVIRVIDIAKGAGVDKIGFITEKILLGQ